MNKRRLPPVLLVLAAIILEILPYGAVLVFGTQGEGDTVERFRVLYSYFDLTPFAYQNYGPFLTALLTVVLLVLTVCLLFRDGKGLFRSARIVATAAFLTALLPRVVGFSYVTAVGVIIAVLLLAAALALFVIEKIT